MRHIFLFLFVVLSFTNITAQNEHPVQFHFRSERVSDTSAILSVKAVLSGGSQLFSIKKSTTDDPFVSAISLDSNLSGNIHITGTVTEKGQLQLVKDTAQGNNYRLFSDSVEFSFPLHILSNNIQKIKGEFVWLGKKGDEFPSGTEKFSVAIPASKNVLSNTVNTGLQEKKPMGWALFLICALTGFLAVFTPCVFPLIPVTVSFFLKKSIRYSQ